MKTTDSNSRKFTYAVCPHCEHANIHVSNGNLAPHHVDILAGVACLGSGMKAEGERGEVMNIGSAEYEIALQMAQQRAFAHDPQEPARRPAFVTWMFSGLQFIALPYDSGSDQIMDATGANYGSWQSVQEFRRRQRAGVIADWQSLGRAHLSVCCER